jgi:Fe-S cluster assembly protein SufD
MELKEKLLSSFWGLDSSVEVAEHINDLRGDAIKVFEQYGFPSKKQEAWKYTSLNKIVNRDYVLEPKGDIAVDFNQVKKYFLHDLDSYAIVFIDGVYSAHLSQTTHDGMDICLLSAALTKPRFRAIIENYFNKAANSESMVSLNTAFASEGAFVYIPKHKSVEKPIQIIHFSTGNDSALLLQPRNLIIADENAHVQIIERHQSLSSHPVFTNVVTEIFGEKRSQIDYYKVQNDFEDASLIDHTFINQETESNCSVHTFSFGGKLIRNNLNFSQNGEHVESTLKGITIIGEKQHVDHSTLVNHNSPNCESHQDYKGIFGDQSTGVFNGRIIVDKLAQKTNAFQANNNILISDKATINTKPQLEIFADDVKCSHGCTVGQLDEDALFYMRTRGIPKKEAQALLTYAFANNVLETVKIPELKQRINKLIANKLGVNIGFNL